MQDGPTSSRADDDDDEVAGGSRDVQAGISDEDASMPSQAGR